MTSRERVMAAIEHREPDRVPIDLGGSIVSSIMATALTRLRQHLRLDDRSVEVYDVFQMLGRVTQDLVDHFDLDLLPVEPEAIAFAHLRNCDFKPRTLFDGTRVMVPGAFDVEVTDKGDWLLHEDSDPQKPVIAHMPKDGYYFDRRSATAWNPDYRPPDIASLKKTNWRCVTDETLGYLAQQARTLRASSDKALVLTPWSGGGLGPAMVGSLPDWLVLLVSEPNYVSELMDLAAEIGIDNLKRYRQAIGDAIDIIHIDGMDYGTQGSEMFSPQVFEKHYVPCYKTQCDWIHAHTPWKIAKHCCGSIRHLIGPMIDAGIDVLNPVQTSAAGMDPKQLKDTFGDHLTFWGGGVDTQRVLPFGTPDEVYNHVVERVKIFAPGGGFIWAAIHNIQHNVPPENIAAALRAVRDEGVYSKKE